MNPANLCNDFARSLPNEGSKLTEAIQPSRRAPPVRAATDRLLLRVDNVDTRSRIQHALVFLAMQRDPEFEKTETELATWNPNKGDSVTSLEHWMQLWTAYWRGRPAQPTSQIPTAAAGLQDGASPREGPAKKQVSQE